MPAVQSTDYFKKTAENYSGDEDQLAFRIAEFINFKENGIIPYMPFKDKSSGKNDRGQVYKPYARNQIRHAHCGFYPNGDPLIAYRVMPNGDIMLICITHHDAMFSPNKRDDFVKQHPDVFEEIEEAQAQ